MTIHYIVPALLLRRCLTAAAAGVLWSLIAALWWRSYRFNVEIYIFFCPGRVFESRRCFGPPRRVTYGLVISRRSKRTLSQQRRHPLSRSLDCSSGANPGKREKRGLDGGAREGGKEGRREGGRVTEWWGGRGLKASRWRGDTTTINIYIRACAFAREPEKEKKRVDRRGRWKAASGTHWDERERERNGEHTHISRYSSSSCGPNKRVCVCVCVCVGGGGLQLSVSGALLSTSCSQVFTHGAPTSWLRVNWWTESIWFWANQTVIVVFNCGFFLPFFVVLLVAAH